MHSDLESLTLDPILVIFKLAQFLPKMIDLLFMPKIIFFCPRFCNFVVITLF